MKFRSKIPGAAAPPPLTHIIAHLQTQQYLYWKLISDEKVKKSLRVIALFLAGLIFLQSCSTYKTPISLEQAAQEEKAVKVITVDDDTYKYKYIIYEDGQFYGVKDNPGEDVKFPIDTEEVTAVMMKKGLPWWAWTLIIIGGIAVLWIVGYLIWGGVDTSGIGPEIIP